MKPLNVASITQPQPLTVTQLSRTLFDVRIAEDIHPETVTLKKRGTENENEEIKQYRHNLYTAAVVATDYGSFIAAVLHLKYNLDDENALICKGIADPKNPEYVAYRAFADSIKKVAAQYFEND